MNRQEFIAELRRSMSGSFSAAEIEDTVSYYEDYIDMQVKKGKREDEVLSELGSPRLLAKSMKAAGQNAGGGGASASEEDSAYGGRIHTFRLPTWLFLLIVLLILLAVLTIVFRVLVAVLPIIVVVVGIVAVYRFFSKK